MNQKRLKLAVFAIIAMASPALAANVRVSHLAPRAPSVDVYLNGQKTFSNIPFRTVTAYLHVPNGVYDVTIYAAGERGNPILEGRNLSFGDETYTITAAGFGPEKSQRPVVFVDNLAPNPNFARLRVINASPDAPTLDIGMRGNLSLLRGVGFKDASSYLRFGPGLFNLEIRFADSADRVLPVPDVSLEAGKVYTLFIVGSRGDGTLNYVLTEDRPSN